ncbi:MAG: DedA family protein [Candidatus Terrybacteria bacterium]|nr:DedA family protein [Candidatus Terrybacteria bacterium]
MKIFVFRIWESLRLWTLKWSHSRHMAAALFFIAFIEASFFPIPPDILLVAILMINAERWWFYAGLTMAGSVIGSFLGYFIGWALYSTVGVYVVNTYHLQSTVDLIGLQYSKHVFLTVFAGTLVFIPFKIFTISAGLFRVPILPMLLAAILGRGLRYFGEAYLIKLFGKRISDLALKYFKIVSIVIGLAAIAAFLAIKFLF